MTARFPEIQHWYIAGHSMGCLLYTSDAADDRISVDLGGRRIIKKIFFKQKTAYEITTRLVGSEMCIRDRYDKSAPKSNLYSHPDFHLW